VVGVAQQLAQRPGDDLPGETVLVLQPAARLRLLVSALGEPIPVVIDFSLRFAVDDERYRLGELEDGAAAPASSYRVMVVTLEFLKIEV
jgi:hypothetical protein